MRVRNFFLISLFLFLLLSPREAFPLQDEGGILSLFREEIESERANLRFEILDSSYAEFDFVGGFADGRYRLKSYRVKPLKENIYRLELLFEKKRGSFRYSQRVVFYFWQGRNRLVFLTKEGKKSFELPDVEINIEKTPSGYRIVKLFKEKVLRLPVEGGTVYLKIRRLK
ncbi:hypothetical protein [Phorcysia thermohydrogeniphila]|uniref:hypothetical protein n=1 Tax=Phorcysia thermohydrogeniphila TaxID=936138 RepID=UPI0010515158|nr:hypothetical protein [Phorcysia thermohydrogeniphila]